MGRHPPALLTELQGFDTPTICNAIETLDDSFRDAGYTRTPLMCAFPELGATVGYARTCMVSTAAPKDAADVADRRRGAYYRHIADAEGPTVVVSQDIDGARGAAATWGEVMATAHKTFGCVGVLTDGAIRDIVGMPDDFQFLAASVKPSHGRLHWVDFDTPVTVAGLKVAPGDLVHMDRNGACVVPHDLAADVPAACRAMQEKEGRILAAAEAGDRAALLRMFGAENP